MLLFGFSLILGSIYFFMKIYSLFANKYFKVKFIFILFCIIGVALLAAHLEPPIDWDLYRHFEEIDRMRINGFEYVWYESRYRTYIFATLLFYISSLTPWNETLVFITIFIELFVLEIILMFYKKKGASPQTESICFFLFLAFSNVVLAISGIRNVLAVIIMNYAIWNSNFRKKINIVDILFIFIAISIHPASAFLLILYFISYIPIIKISSGIALFFLPLLTKISQKYLDSNNELISSSAGLFKLYTKEDLGLDIRVLIVSAIFIFISIIIILYRIVILKDRSRYLKYALTYSLGTLGMISQSYIYSRMLYGLGNIYIYLLLDTREKNKNYKKMMQIYKIVSIIYISGMLLFQGYELTLSLLYK